jgi:hypothetical protein
LARARIDRSVVAETGAAGASIICSPGVSAVASASGAVGLPDTSAGSSGPVTTSWLLAALLALAAVGLGAWTLRRPVERRG